MPMPTTTPHNSTIRCWNFAHGGHNTPTKAISRRSNSLATTLAKAKAKAKAKVRVIRTRMVVVVVVVLGNKTIRESRDTKDFQTLLWPEMGSMVASIQRQTRRHTDPHKDRGAIFRFVLRGCRCWHLCICAFGIWYLPFAICHLPFSIWRLAVEYLSVGIRTDVFEMGLEIEMALLYRRASW